MSKRNNKLLLEDIFDSIDKILRYVNGFSLENFESDEKTIDAVVRNFEIIGEAANHLTNEYIANNTQIDWHKIIGFRNRLIHHYFGVDTEVIWQIISDNLPDLKTLIEESIKKID